MKKQTLMLFAFLCASLGLFAQINVYDVDPAQVNQNIKKDNHQLEVGIHAGHIFAAGNISFFPGYAGGLHVRRALGYVFSLRADMLYGKLRGEDPGNVRSFENRWFSTSLLALASLNNIKWTPGERKTNLYLMGGIGTNTYNVDLTESNATNRVVDGKFAIQTEFGGGLAFKVTERLNVGIEHKAGFLLGDRSDLLDGLESIDSGDNRNTFRDFLHYTSVRINMNIGKSEDLEPLYWVNPLKKNLDTYDIVEATYQDTLPPPPVEQVNQLETRMTEAELAEQRAMDKEAIIRETRAEVMKEVDALLEARLQEMENNRPEPLSTRTIIESSGGSGSSGGVSTESYLLLLTIYFENGGDKLEGEDIVSLISLSKIMEDNANMKMVVTGHADPSGASDINDYLSYKRAQTVVDYLVEHRFIPRDRLVLEWKGERFPLVSGTKGINRRVTFRVANLEKDMPPPPKPKKRD